MWLPLQNVPTNSHHLHQNQMSTRGIEPPHRSAANNVDAGAHNAYHKQMPVSFAGARASHPGRCPQCIPRALSPHLRGARPIKNGTKSSAARAARCPSSYHRLRHHLLGAGAETESLARSFHASQDTPQSAFAASCSFRKIEQHAPTDATSCPSRDSL